MQLKFESSTGEANILFDINPDLKWTTSKLKDEFFLICFDWNELHLWHKNVKKEDYLIIYIDKCWAFSN